MVLVVSRLYFLFLEMLLIFIFLVHLFLCFIELHRLNKVLNLVLQLCYFLCKFIFVIILDTLTQKLESWAQLFEGRLTLNLGLNLTRVSFSCVQKHFLG